MESLYAQYLKERTNDKIIEVKQGFLTYRYMDNNIVYIVDIFVLPEYRKAGWASSLANLVVGEAQGLGYKELIGSVAPWAKGAHESILVLIAYGMKFHSCDKDLIVFKKEI